MELVVLCNINRREYYIWFRANGSVFTDYSGKLSFCSSQMLLSV